MELKDICTSKKESEQLKEAGFTQDATAYWQRFTTGNWILVPTTYFDGIRNGEIEVDGAEVLKDMAEDGDDAVAAHCLQTLLEALPDVIEIRGRPFDLHIGKTYIQYRERTGIIIHGGKVEIPEGIVVPSLLSMATEAILWYIKEGHIKV
jgi:hypothetical protein